MPGSVAQAVAWRHFSHPQLLEILDNVRDAGLACTIQVKATQDEIDLSTPQFFCSTHDIHDPWVSTAGDNDQSLFCLDHQRLFLDLIPKLSG